LDRLYDADEADSDKDYEEGEYPKELLAAGAVAAKRNWNRFLETVLPQAQAHVKTKKVPKAERDELQELVFSPLQRWLEKDEDFLRRMRERDLAAVDNDNDD
jgi:hypothetical protein